MAGRRRSRAPAPGVERAARYRAVAATAAVLLVALLAGCPDRRADALRARSPRAIEAGPSPAVAEPDVFPVSVSANGRYLVDWRGRPWRIQADAAWMMSSNATPEEVETYLDTRRALSHHPNIHLFPPPPRSRSVTGSGSTPSSIGRPRAGWR